MRLCPATLIFDRKQAVQVLKRKDGHNSLFVIIYLNYFPAAEKGDVPLSTEDIRDQTYKSNNILPKIETLF